MFDNLPWSHEGSGRGRNGMLTSNKGLAKEAICGRAA